VLKVFILLLTLLPLSVYSAQRPVESKTVLKNKINIYNKKLRVITRELKSVEKRLEKVNKKYLRVSKNKQTVEDNIESMQMILSDEKEKLETTFVKLKKRMLHVAMLRLGNTQDAPEKIVVNKLIYKSLQNEMRAYKTFKRRLLSMDKRLDSLAKELQGQRERESELLDVVANLEQKKKLEALSFVKNQKTRDKLKSTLKQKSRKKKTKNIKSIIASIGLFTPPIEQRSSMDYKKKGVTFYFRKSQAVRATRKGKVIHSGSLSAYGNVVIIDHGAKTRSVLLGDFTPKVKKGSIVNEGATLGYAKLASGREGKLYFEVRRSKKAQDTINLLKN
jgi:septal ring factor EnvC (AmiA/AmiB activator)